MKPILLATDGSPSAEAATREAIDLAARLDLPLLAVCVEHDTAPGYGYYGFAEVVAEMRKTRHEEIRKLLTHTAERAAAAGVRCVTAELEGLVGEEICREARERDARMIVIGAHGWGPINRLIHGSVSTFVLHHATTPVLVVTGAEDRAASAEAPAETASLP